MDTTTTTSPAQTDNEQTLQYGDIVELSLAAGEPSAVYFVKYVDRGTLQLVPQDPAKDEVQLAADEHGQLRHGTQLVPTVVLLDRAEKPGYVLQHKLEPGQRVLLEVRFQDRLIPVRGTLVHTDAALDVAELQPEDADLTEPLVLEFGFHGLPVWIDRLEVLSEEEDVDEDLLQQELQTAAATVAQAAEQKQQQAEGEEEGEEENATKNKDDVEITWTPAQFAPEIVKRVPKQVLQPFVFKPDVVEQSYVLNSRETFVEFIQAMLTKQQLQESAGTTTDAGAAGIKLMQHQEVVRNYMNMYTPYRGLLLYHGLGAGKTCTSIAVAEGMKSSKVVYVLTPASLRWNYLEELKKCADVFYKRQQFWEWIPAASVGEDVLRTMAALLQMPVTHIRAEGGVWFINVQRPSNYDQLTREQQVSLERQLNFMIERKYKFISYNGLTKERMQQLTQGFRVNPFDHAVVIVDEAHNLVSRIVNKLAATGSGLPLPQAPLALQLYELLLRAQDCRLLLLTGTPLVNFPNELGVMFNLLRGYIRTWRLTLTQHDSRNNRLTNDLVRKMLFANHDSVDYVDYSPTSHILTVTRNPYAFVSVHSHKQVKRQQQQSTALDDDAFVARIAQLLKQSGVEVGRVELQLQKALPDRLDDFLATYIDEVGLTLKNADAFKRRIIGLTSFFQMVEDTTQLMPRFRKETDLHFVRVPMSAMQFAHYRLQRLEEIEQDTRRRRFRRRSNNSYSGSLYEKNQSTFRIFSRLACNFFVPGRVKPATFRASSTTAAAAAAATKRVLPSGQNKTKTHKKRRDTAVVEEEGEEKEELEGAKADGEEEDEQPEVEGEEEEPEGEEQVTNDDEHLEGDLALQRLDSTYAEALKNQMRELLTNHPNLFVQPSAQFPNGQLPEYSAKFSAALSNLQDPSKKGCHMVYSQFRTAEGIGLFTKVLLANGYTEFKLKKQHGVWYLDCTLSYPMFVLHTGTEDEEVKEMVRRVFNSDWEDLPEELRHPLNERFANQNIEGQVIQTLLITSSGSEGITLKNVHWVHCLDLYWHPVRLQQVVGRALRMGSQAKLPPADRWVQVFVYLSVMTPEQKKVMGEALTTDEYLLELCDKKEKLNAQLLQAVQESAFDCFLHDKQKQLRCLNFEAADDAFRFSYVPDYRNQKDDGMVEVNRVQETLVSDGTVTVGKLSFAYKKKKENDTVELFDLAAYNQGQVVRVGYLKKLADGNWRVTDKV